MKNFIVLPLLLFALLGISATANAGFEVEPNNAFAEASSLSLNEVFSGSFDNRYGGSSDYYKLSLVKASEVVFHYRNRTENPSSVEFGLYTASQNYIFGASIEASNLLDNSFKINLAAGTFYIKISNNYYNPINSSYEISALSTLSVPRPISIPSVVGSVNLPDLNGNGYKDIAILRILADTRAVVDTIDGFTGKQLKRVIYISDSRAIQPISIIGFDDMNGNGSPEIGVLGYNSTTGKHTQYIRNALTGALVKSFVIN